METDIEIENETEKIFEVVYTAEELLKPRSFKIHLPKSLLDSLTDAGQKKYITNLLAEIFNNTTANGKPLTNIKCDFKAVGELRGLRYRVRFL